MCQYLIRIILCKNIENRKEKLGYNKAVTIFCETYYEIGNEALRKMTIRNFHLGKR